MLNIGANKAQFKKRTTSHQQPIQPQNEMNNQPQNNRGKMKGQQIRGGRGGRGGMTQNNHNQGGNHPHHNQRGGRGNYRGMNNLKLLDMFYKFKK